MSHSGSRVRRSMPGVVLVLIALALLGAACVAPAPATAVPATAAPATATAAPTATQAAAGGPAVDLSKVPTGVDADGNFYRGDPNAAVKLLEYSDFQCPFCGRHSTTTGPQIDQTYVATGQVLHVFRNFPLQEIHPNAMPAAKAAYCAGQQKPALFWGMHDWLFANQAGWSDAQDAAAQMRKEAVALGANGDALDKCIAAPETETRIQKDLSDGAQRGVQGTPAFFVNDWFVNGAQPFAAFQTAIEKAQAGKHPPPTPTPLPQGANFYDADPNRPGLTYDGSPTLGDAKAPIIVLAFNDFKCAECGGFFKDVLPGLRDKYIKNGQVRVIYAYYPSEGPKAAVAGVCAARQGKFWEFSDALFAHQSEWKDGDDAAMAGYAKGVGIDEAKFGDCLKDPTAQAQVDSAEQFAKEQIGVPQTPAYLLADLKQNKSLGAMVGAQPLSEFTNKIEAGLNPPAATPEAGPTEAPAATPTAGN